MEEVWTGRSQPFLGFEAGRWLKGGRQLTFTYAWREATGVRVLGPGKGFETFQYILQWTQVLKLESESESPGRLISYGFLALIPRGSRGLGRYISSKLWCWYCWSREKALQGTPVQVSSEKSIPKMPALVQSVLLWQSILIILITAHLKLNQTISSDHWPCFLGFSTSMKWTRSGQPYPASQARTFHCSHANWQLHSLSSSIVLYPFSHQSADALKIGEQCFWAKEPNQWVTWSMVHTTEVGI